MTQYPLIRKPEQTALETVRRAYRSDPRTRELIQLAAAALSVRKPYRVYGKTDATRAAFRYAVQALAATLTAKAAEPVKLKRAATRTEYQIKLGQSFRSVSRAVYLEQNTGVDLARPGTRKQTVYAADLTAEEIAALYAEDVAREQRGNPQAPEFFEQRYHRDLSRNAKLEDNEHFREGGVYYAGSYYSRETIRELNRQGLDRFIFRHLQPAQERTQYRVMNPFTERRNVRRAQREELLKLETRQQSAPRQPQQPVRVDTETYRAERLARIDRDLQLERDNAECERYAQADALNNPVYDDAALKVADAYAATLPEGKAPRGSIGQLAKLRLCARIC